MSDRRLLFLTVAFLATGLSLAAKPVVAATPSFTLAANNVTMAPHVANSVPFTLTSVDGYSGMVNVTCSPTSAPTAATLPICGGGGAVATPPYTLEANGTIQGNIALGTTFCPTTACPVKFDRAPRRFPRGLALAGVLLFGLGLRRRWSKWMPLGWMPLRLILLTFGMFAGLAGFSACGGGSNKTLTPGVWAFTVIASSSGTNPVVSVNTTVNVTIPSGFQISYY